mgnify:FL=1
MYERFSLDVEASFETFANLLSEYMMKHRGVILTFNIFDAQRIIVINDTQ